MNKEEVVLFETKKVYDPFLRFVHFWNGLSLFALMLTIWLKGLVEDQFSNGSVFVYHLHVYIGYAFSVGICARLLWGFVGPQHAKFKNMWFFSSWLMILKTRKIQAFQDWGHDRYASLAYLVFYLLMAYQIVSGLVLAAAKFGLGPFSLFILQKKTLPPFAHNLKEIHEIVFYFSMVYVVVHLGMIKVHEIARKSPIAQSMFSGFQYRRLKK